MLEAATDDSALFVFWTAPTGTLTGYDVHYTSAPATGTGMVSNTAAASGSNPATAWVADSRGTENTPPTAEHTITGLNNGTAYRVRVRAKNSNGAGTWAFATGTPQVGSPLEPVNLAVTADHTTLSLSWNRNPSGGPPASYAVHYTASATVSGSDGPGTNPATHWVDTGYSGSATSYTITGLTNGQTYRVRVDARNAGGSSDWEDSSGTPLARTVSLSVSPTIVTEGFSVTVTATLSRTHSSALTIPVTITDNTAESTDHGTLSGITIAAGSTSATGTISTNQDTDEDDETFTVSLGTLPPAVSAGSPSSVTVRIVDDDKRISVSLSPTAVRVDEGQRFTMELVFSRQPRETHGWIRLISEDRCTGPRHHELTTGISFTRRTGFTQSKKNIRTGNVREDTVCTIRIDPARIPDGYVVGAGGTLTVTIVDIPDPDPRNDGGGDPPPDGDPPPGDDDSDPPPGGPPAGGPPGGGGGPAPDDDDDDDDGDNDGDGGGPTPDDDDDDGDGDGDGDDDGGPPSAAIETDAVCEAGLCRARTGAAVPFRDASTGSVSTRLWDFDDGAPSRSAAPSHSWASPGFYQVTLTVGDGTVESTDSLTFLVEAAEPAGTCAADDDTRCLRDSRFAVEMEWWTGEDRGGPGKVVPEGTNGSALFHFFEPGDNWEVLIKVLDGCSVNEHVWVYGASATTLGYAIRVTDTVTGAVREYMNEDGRRADAIADSEAFAGVCDDGPAAAAAEPSTAAVATSSSSPAAAVASSPLAGGAALLDPAAPVAVEAGSGEDVCTESATTMCLLGGRYEVSASWSAPPAAGAESGDTGPGRVARARTPDSGLFYFFDQENWEMLVKVLDACEGYGHHWVFAASATDLGLDLTVRDTVTGEVRNYVRDPGEPSPAVADVSAFPNGCSND